MEGVGSRGRPSSDSVFEEAETVGWTSMYRAECHATAALFYSNVHVSVGTAAAGLAAAAGGTAFAGYGWIAGTGAIVAAALAGLLTSLRPDEKSQGHWQDANNYFDLAAKTYTFIRFPGEVIRFPSEVADASQQVATGPSEEPQRHLPPGQRSLERAQDEKTLPLTTLFENLQAFKRSYGELERTSLPVASRLAGHATANIQETDSWYPPQDESFDRWREKKIEGEGRKGPIRGFFRALRNLW